MKNKFDYGDAVKDNKTYFFTEYPYLEEHNQITKYYAMAVDENDNEFLLEWNIELDDEGNLKEDSQGDYIADWNNFKVKEV